MLQAAESDVPFSVRCNVPKELKVREVDVIALLGNRKGNTIWFLAQVYKGEKRIAKTGILYPDEYVEKISCSKNLSAGDKVLIKILAYEPDTYHSEGVAQISAAVTTK